MRRKVGVVLSGGGVKGLAHVGFLKALSEYEIIPEYISGSSSGAIVGLLHAAGCSAEQIIAYFIKNANIFSLGKVTRKKVGIFDSEKYISTLDDIIPIDDFSALNCKLIVNATDIIKGESVYFESGDVKKKVIASAAIPGIFSPLEFNGAIYVDGGTMDNFPVKPLLGKNLEIFGSYVSYHKTATILDISTTLKLVNRAGKLAFNAGSIHQFHLCDHLIAPMELSDFSIFDTKRMNEIFEIGYNHTKEYLSDMIDM